jgi:hypothetical protein
MFCNDPLPKGRFYKYITCGVDTRSQLDSVEVFQPFLGMNTYSRVVKILSPKISYDLHIHCSYTVSKP